MCPCRCNLLRGRPIPSKKSNWWITITDGDFTEFFPSAQLSSDQNPSLWLCKGDYTTQLPFKINHYKDPYEPVHSLSENIGHPLGVFFFFGSSGCLFSPWVTFFLFGEPSETRNPEIKYVFAKRFGKNKKQDVQKKIHTS